MQTKIKDLRVQADALAQYLKDLSVSWEITQATRSILFGKAWLGKLLGELGVESPYPKDGERHDLKDIEETADKASPTDKASLTYEVPFTDFNQIEMVDILRQKLNELVDEVVEINTTDHTREFSIARTNAYTKFSEARFWLGFELERIREEAQYQSEEPVKTPEVVAPDVFTKALAAEALTVLAKNSKGNLRLFLGKIVESLKEVSEK